MTALYHGLSGRRNHFFHFGKNATNKPWNKAKTPPGGVVFARFGKTLFHVKQLVYIN
jgi:hypothetical protein